jgi:hypothetical protein
MQIRSAMSQCYLLFFLLSQLGAVTCSFTPKRNATQIQVKRGLGEVRI